MNKRTVRHGWGDTPPIQIVLITEMLATYGSFESLADMIGCSAHALRDYWTGRTKSSFSVDDALIAMFPEHEDAINKASPYYGTKCAFCGEIVPMRRIRYKSVFCSDDCYRLKHGRPPKKNAAPSEYHKWPLQLPEWFHGQNSFTAFDGSAVCG